MPICSKCGAINEETAFNCLKCGDPLMEIAIMVDDPIAHLVEDGERALQRGELEEAFGHFESALQIQLKSPHVLKRMVEIAKRLGDSVRLSRCYVTLSQITADPEKRADYLVQAAIITRDGRGDPRKACAALEMALKLAPWNDEAFSMLRSIYRQSRSWEELTEVYKRVILYHSKQASPKRGKLAQMWSELAGFYERLRRFDDAKAARSMQQQYSR